MSLRERDASSRSNRAPSRSQKGLAASTGERTMPLWDNAQVTSRSAKLLLETGDTDGAINRAYYAVFNAARAALATCRSPLALSKRHGTIFRRFEKHLVQERGFDASLGKAFLARQRSARQVADYGERRCDVSMARLAVADMDRFLAAVERFLDGVRR